MSALTCPLCGGRTKHVERWDSFACLTCDKWVEAECDCAEDCVYKGRPESPSSAPERER